MKPKHGTIYVSLLLALVATLLFTVLPVSANSIIAYVFILIGIALMESGILIASRRNVPATYAFMYKAGRFLLLSLTTSIVVLTVERLKLYTLSAKWMVVIQMVMLVFCVIDLIHIKTGEAYMDQIEKKNSAHVRCWGDIIRAAQSVAMRETDMQMKQMVEQVAEELRYSDPASVSDSAEIDERIAEMTNQLTLMNGEALKAACEELLLVIQERNALVKSRK